MGSSPRWKAAIERAIGEHTGSVVIQLATTSDAGVPRVRSVIFRGFVSESESGLYGVPLLLATTDMRAGKVRELAGRAEVEVVWWVEGSQEQFRMGGRAFVVPAPPGEGVQDNVITRAGVDWERKRREVFNGMSARMRATWCVPVAPGSRLAGGYEEMMGFRGTLAGLGEAGDDEERRDVERAFGNFGLVVIEPVVVDYLELGVVPHRRTVFRCEGGGWVEEVVVP